MQIKIIIAITALTLLTSCGQRSAKLEFKTVELKEFTKHPKASNDEEGLEYVISISYPKKYGDPVVLEKLQKQFIRCTFGEPCNNMTLEKAIETTIAGWKKAYDEENAELQKNNNDPDLVIGIRFVCSNTIAFQNENLLALKTKSGFYPYAAHVFEDAAYCLFNLQTGELYSRDDIFKPESADNIRRLILSELLHTTHFSATELRKYDIWNRETNFSVTGEGIIILYNDSDFDYDIIGAHEITIPHERFLPYLREGTPVWDIANSLMRHAGAGKTGQQDNETASDTESQEVEHYHWFCNQDEHQGAEIVFARLGDVFRGEYIDPGFQDFCSLPIVGTIDNEGNIKGVCAIIHEDGNIYAMLSGRITGNKFKAVWMPASIETSEFREMEMEYRAIPPDRKTEINKHPGTFYNFLYPERPNLTASSSDGTTISRITPLIAKDVFASESSQEYGYRVGEWEKRTIIFKEGIRKNEVDFRLQVELSGQADLSTTIQGTARLNGNRFRYNEKGYEFEVAVYNGFVTVKSISGSIDLSDREVEEEVIFKADGVYPASMKQRFYH